MLLPHVIEYRAPQPLAVLRSQFGDIERRHRADGCDGHATAPRLLTAGVPPVAQQSQRRVAPQCVRDFVRADRRIFTLGQALPPIACLLVNATASGWELKRKSLLWCAWLRVFHISPARSSLPIFTSPSLSGATTIHFSRCASWFHNMGYVGAADGDLMRLKAVWLPLPTMLLSVIPIWHTCARAVSGIAQHVLCFPSVFVAAKCVPLTSLVGSLGHRKVRRCLRPTRARLCLVEHSRLRLDAHRR